MSVSSLESTNECLFVETESQTTGKSRAKCKVLHSTLTDERRRMNVRVQCEQLQTRDGSIVLNAPLFQDIWKKNPTDQATRELVQVETLSKSIK